MNFNNGKLAQAADYVHSHGKKLHVAIGCYALIIADLGGDYAANKYPNVERHVSVQASTTNIEAIRFFHENFAVDRVVLPRVLLVQQVKQQLSSSLHYPLNKKAECNGYWHQIAGMSTLNEV